MDQHGWQDKNHTVSTFRGQTNIFIFRPTIIFPSQELKFELKNKIGGFLGIATTNSNSTIIFDKNEYYVGEKVHVRIICDNTNCKKAVRGFKLKLHRHYVGKDNGAWSTSGASYISFLKAPGCPAKTKVEREYSIDIPTHDPVSNHNILGPDHQSLANAFSTSVQGQLIMIGYTLRCYVKHDAWNEFGEGNCVRLPIKIV